MGPRSGGRIPGSYQGVASVTPPATKYTFSLLGLPRRSAEIRSLTTRLTSHKPTSRARFINSASRFEKREIEEGAVSSFAENQQSSGQAKHAFQTFDGEKETPRASDGRWQIHQAAMSLARIRPDSAAKDEEGTARYRSLARFSNAPSLSRAYLTDLPNFARAAACVSGRSIAVLRFLRGSERSMRTSRRCT